MRYPCTRCCVFLLLYDLFIFWMCETTYQMWEGLRYSTKFSIFLILLRHTLCRVFYFLMNCFLIKSYIYLPSTKLPEILARYVCKRLIWRKLAQSLEQQNIIPLRLIVSQLRQVLSTHNNNKIFNFCLRFFAEFYDTYLSIDDSE